MKRHNHDTKSVKSIPFDDHPVGAMLKLQHRKEQLERRLDEKCAELKKLCIKEFELTGILPRETPLDANGSPPKVRRKIATMYPYDKEFLKQLAQQPPPMDNGKRKALSPWSSCDNLPFKTTTPVSPKRLHNTWTSPQSGEQSSHKGQHISHLMKPLKFLKKRPQ